MLEYVPPFLFSSNDTFQIQFNAASSKQPSVVSLSSDHSSIACFDGSYHILLCIIVFYVSTLSLFLDCEQLEG